MKHDERDPSIITVIIDALYTRYGFESSAFTYMVMQRNDRDLANGHLPNYIYYASIEMRELHKSGTRLRRGGYGLTPEHALSQALHNMQQLIAHKDKKGT